MDDFPANSMISKESKSVTEPGAASSNGADKPEKLEKIVTGKVTRKKKSLGKKFKEHFTSGEQSFAEYLVEEVIVPGIKELMVNAVRQMFTGFAEGIEQQITGGVRHRGSGIPRPPSGRSGPIAYHQASSTRSSIRRSGSYDDRPRIERRHSDIVEDVIVSTRREGDRVIEILEAKIADYGHCTVGDLYDLVGEDSRSVDHEWGWTNLDRARVNMVRHDAYQIYVPPPHAIRTGR